MCKHDIEFHKQAPSRETCPEELTEAHLSQVWGGGQTSSPNLAHACCTGKHISEATITAR
jgi:hypothetical protein